MRTLLAAIILMASTSLAMAQPACDDPSAGYSVAQTLMEKYKEASVAVGTSNQGHVFMWWGNSSENTWSITRTTQNPDGTSTTCLMAGGQEFFMQELPPEGELN